MIDGDRRLAPRLAQIVILAILVGIGLNHVVFAVRDWPLGDMDVYLAAAQRLRDGEPLYISGDVAVNSYWYAPWYAVLWIPMTYLPREVVATGWSALLLVATLAVVVLLGSRGRRGVTLALLVGPMLFAVSAGGNIQALMVLALLVGFHRRWGPAAVGLAASLKFAPMLLAVAYIARGEWMRAAVSLALAGLLLLPSVLLGVTDAGVRSEAAPSLIGFSPVLYGTVVLACMVGVFFVPRRHRVLAAAVAGVLALPRLFVYDVSLVAAGAADEPGPSSVSAEREGNVPV